jgi:hypothetical protein
MNDESGECRRKQDQSILRYRPGIRMHRENLWSFSNAVSATHAISYRMIGSPTMSYFRYYLDN